MIKPIFKKTLTKTLPLILVLTVIVWIGINNPIRSMIAKQKEIEEQTKVISQSQEKLDYLKGHQANSSEINRIYQTVKNLWPDSEEVSEFTVQLEGLASEKNLTLNSLSLTKLQSTPKKATDTKEAETENDKQTESKKSTKVTGLKFSFDTKTNYDNGRNLIIGLENLARLNSIESISISSNQENILNISISGNIYDQ